MKRSLFLIFIFFGISVTFPVIIAQDKISSDKEVSPREHLLMDFKWCFAFGDADNTDRDFTNGTSYFTYFAKTGYGDGAAAPDFEDRTWRIVNLPHDWAAELPFDSTASHSHGYKTIGQKYPAVSVGWYRKSFSISEEDFGKKISIQFDGIFRNSSVWVNGFYVGHELSGYASSEYDITDYLNYGGNNVVAVRVDASIEEGWYYEGAGIYRHVWLNKTSRLHIAQYGTFVSTELAGKSALVKIRTTVENNSQEKASFKLEHTIVDALGKVVTVFTTSETDINANRSDELFSEVKIAEPRLWSIEDPFMHKVITRIISGGKTTDIYETPFGIRTVQFDPDKGFFLNGKNVKIKGSNVHQDHAGVGTAIPDALQEFRIKRLREMGSNAIRTSHNPPTPELLDACDKLGMLVLNENRLMGSNKEHFDLLERLIKRDRNHPSVIIWSLGNEEWAIEGNEKGARIAATMQEFAMQLDSTRRFTAAMSGGWGHGISTVIDVMGYNYLVQGNIDEHHSKFPQQPSMQTEETTTQGTRGIYIDNRINGHMAPTDRTKKGGNIEVGWKYCLERPFLSGLFFWTGFDYRGEPNPLRWPAVSSQFGIVDLCGFPKDVFYYLKSWWTEEPVLHISPHWNWKGKEGDTINVWAQSNCDEVELLLNGKSLGRKKMNLNEHLEWNVPYEPGTLIANALRNGKEVLSRKTQTTGISEILKLTPDRESYKADGEDVAVITVDVRDNKELIVPDADNEIFFSISGPGKIIGVGNGDPASHEPDQFFDLVETVPIENLKLMATEPGQVNEPTNPDYKDSDWQPAFVSSYGEYEDGKHIVVRGSFMLPDFTKETEITLFSKSLAEGQKVYVNGKLVGGSIKRDDPAEMFILDHSIIHKGKNIIAITGKPFVKRTRWENISTDPGIVKISNPAAQWRRKVFNGLVQVIVQMDKKDGEIVLKASSEGLKEGEIKLNSKSVDVKKFVD